MTLARRPSDEGDGRRRPSDVARRGRPGPGRGRVRRGRHAPGDGAQAVRRARAAGPDVLVLDLNLPGHARRPGLQGARRRRPGAAGPGALRERRARRRTGGGEVRRHRLSAEVGRRRGADRRGAPHGGRATRCSPRAWPGWCSASTAGWPPSPRPPPPTSRRSRSSPSARRRCCGWSPRGCRYKQIAERLVISHRTVQNHVQNTLGKLQLHNRVELVRYAIERGLDDALRPSEAEAPGAACTRSYG